MVTPSDIAATKLAVVIAAAGTSRRFGSDKLEADLNGRTVLEHAVSACREALPNAPVTVVVAADRLQHWQAVLARSLPDAELCVGGARRQDSVRVGVMRALEHGADRVVVHDGARPLVSAHDVRAVVDASEGADAAVLCAEVHDTVKRVDGARVVGTVDRRELRLAQTPQVVSTAALVRAWRRQNPSREWTDEAALVEADGGDVRVVVAGHPNPKLNTAWELDWFRAMVGGGG